MECVSITRRLSLWEYSPLPASASPPDTKPSLSIQLTILEMLTLPQQPSVKQETHLTLFQETINTCTCSSLPRDFTFIV